MSDRLRPAPASSPSWLAAFRQSLAEAGLDLAEPFDLARYNAAIAGHERLRPVTPFGSSSLALLVGNTRAFWPVFLAALRASPALLRSEDPIDDYVTGLLAESVRRVPCASEVRFAHEGGDRLVGMAALAEAAALAEIGPARLLIHPTFGPWFALRALVVLDHPAPVPTAPFARSCPGCAAPCVPAFARAIAETGVVTTESLRAHHEAWVGVRDACPVGREHRYDAEQIAYHYTKDLARLRRL